MQYQFKSVPFIGRGKDVLNAKIIAQQLTEIINVNSQGGWEFDQINNVNIAVQAGCIASLFGQKSFEQRFDMLIFRKLLTPDLRQPSVQDQNISNNLGRQTTEKSAVTSPSFRSNNEAPDYPDARCPNCKSLILSDSIECWKCKAAFGENSAWKPLHLSPEELNNATLQKQHEEAIDRRKKRLQE